MTNPSSLQIVAYEYDGLDRRTRRTVRNAAGTVTAQQRFLYDSNVLSSAHPLGGDGALRADEAANWEPVIVLDERLAGEPYQEVDHRYLNGPLIDQVFADETGGNGVLWYLSDTQNTVRDVAKYGSSTAGTQATVRNHLEYNTFGIVTTADDPTTVTVNDGDRPGLEGTGNEFSPQRSYTGREPDTATGLIYYRARWYDPRIGRFISEDPIGFAAGDANLSRYVGNSAPNAVDPSGLFGDPEYVVHWHHLFPQEFKKNLKSWGIPESFINSPENGWYLMAEDHWKVHSENGTDEWNRDWKKWVDSKAGKKVSESELLEQMEYMKRKHGLVNIDGSPRMGQSVAASDRIPYDDWKKGPEHVQEWRDENGGCRGYNASPSEKERVRKDAKLRSEGKPRGTKPAPGFTEKTARTAAKSAADNIAKVKKALKVLTAVFVATGALETGKTAFGGVLALNDPEAMDEYRRAMDGLIRHQKDPSSTGLSDAEIALFGPVDLRTNSTSLLIDKPKGVVTKMLAAYAQSEGVNWYAVSPLYEEAQDLFFNPDQIDESEQKSTGWMSWLLGW